MIEKLFKQAKRSILLAITCSMGLFMSAQSGTFGNSFVFSGTEAAIHSVTHNFSSGGGSPLNGILGTERVSPQGYLSFVGISAHLGASDSTHVDGYVKTYMSSAFIFPIGDNGKYRPARVSIASLANPANAAYFGVDPTVAVTSSLKGGNEPALPSSTYSSSTKAANVQNVSTAEYWDINGTQAAQISLTWGPLSGVAAMTGGVLGRLTIVGWNGTQWVEVPSSVDVTSSLGGTSTTSEGSITTNAAIVPSSFDVYTLAVVCPNVTAPTAAVVSPNPLCLGSTATLSATSHVTDTLMWYRDAGLTALEGMGSPVSVSPASSTTYYAIYQNGVCRTGFSAVTLIVNPSAAISSFDTVNPTSSSCSSKTGSITLKGLTPNSMFGITYTDPSGSNVPKSGFSDASGNLVLGSLVGGSYTNIQLSRLSCLSNIIAKIQLTPSAPTAAAPNTSPICLGKSSILSATGSGDTITWFADTALTASLGISPLTVTPPITSKYFVAIVNGTCKSASSSVTVVVTNDCPNFPISDTTLKNPGQGVVSSVGPVTNAPTGGSLVASIVKGFLHKSVDAQSINPATGVITFTTNDTAFVGKDTIWRSVCFTLGGVTTCDTSMIIIDNKAPNLTKGDTTNLNTPKVLSPLNPVLFSGGNPTTTTSSTRVTVSSGIPKYTPVDGFLGIDTQYVYRCDGSVPPNCDTTRLIIWVLPNIADVKDSTKSNTPVNLGPAVTPQPGKVTDNSIANNGTVTNNPDGSITYTPNTNFVGTDTVKRRVCVTTTSGTTCDTQLLVINVAPKYNDTSANTRQREPVTSGQPVLVMQPGSVVSIVTTGPSNGTKVVNANGTVTYTPNPSFVGSDTIVRIVCVTFTDASQRCDTSLLIFSVTPNVLDSKDSTVMNVTKVIGSPVSGPSITVTASSVFGSTTVNPDGTLTYVPRPGFVGVDTVTRIVCDIAPNPDICDTSIIIMSVTPGLKDTINSGKMNTPVNIGNPLTLGPGATQELKSPSNGTVVINSDGTLKYTPNQYFVGLDTVRQIVCVGGICDTALLIIRVAPNVPDITGVTRDFTAVIINGPDIAPGAGTSISHTGIGGPSNGFATVRPSTGVVIYTPIAGFVGIDTVIVLTCATYLDRIVKCDTHLVIIQVGLGILYRTNPDLAIGVKGDQITGNVKTNDIVVSGTTYGTPIAASTNPTSAVPVMNQDGTYTFTSTVPGTYVFTVPVCPPGRTTGCPTETLTIAFLDPLSITNKPIVISDESVTKPGSPTTIDVLANDAGGNVGFPLDKSTLTISTPPLNGSVTVNADGTVTYTPRTRFVGFDTFYYTVCDLISPPNCGTARVIVNVTNDNLAVVQDDVAVGTGMITGNTLSNDKFPSGSNPRVKPMDITIPGKGRFIVDSLGNYTWVPESGFVGSVQITITTCDGLSPEMCYSSTIHFVTNALEVPVPNYISPNGDDNNDVWNIDLVLARFPKTKATIYNRWGNIVWRSTGPYGLSTSGSNVWKGQLEGSNEMIPDGVYFYLLEMSDNLKTTKTGFIEVMRQ